MWALLFVFNVRSFDFFLDKVKNFTSYAHYGLTDVALILLNLYKIKNIAQFIKSIGMQQTDVSASRWMPSKRSVDLNFSWEETERNTTSKMNKQHK